MLARQLAAEGVDVPHGVDVVARRARSGRRRLGGGRRAAMADRRDRRRRRAHGEPRRPRSRRRRRGDQRPRRRRRRPDALERAVDLRRRRRRRARAVHPRRRRTRRCGRCATRSSRARGPGRRAGAVGHVHRSRAGPRRADGGRGRRALRRRAAWSCTAGRSTHNDRAHTDGATGAIVLVERVGGCGRSWSARTCSREAAGELIGELDPGHRAGAVGQPARWPRARLPDDRARASSSSAARRPWRRRFGTVG